MSRIQPLLLCVLLAFTFSAQASEDNHYNRVRFQVDVSETVANDRMEAVLAAETETASADEAAATINEVMGWALDRARDAEGAKVSTGNYTITPVYRKDRPQRWRGMQELRLEGGDFAALGALIGELQQRLQIKNTRFYIAESTRETVETRLIDQTIERFNRRAEQIRKQFAAETYLLVEASIRTSGGVRPDRVMRVAAMAESMSPPALEGGEGEVVVAISGVIELE